MGEWNIGYCVRRDVALTICGSLVASIVEVFVVLLWSTGSVEFSETPVYAQPCRTLFVVAALSYWSDVHFWFAHRLLHPWFGKGGGVDPGLWLYRHVHSVHHKSHNPGPWSGLAMHPVEHAVYVFFK